MELGTREQTALTPVGSLLDPGVQGHGPSCVGSPSASGPLATPIHLLKAAEDRAAAQQPVHWGTGQTQDLPFQGSAVGTGGG